MLCPIPSTRPLFALATSLSLLFLSPSARAQEKPAAIAPPTTIAALARSKSMQKQDAGYTAKIRQFTTGPEFMTELVDHLPASDRVPTPEKVLGYISGAEGHLTYTTDVNRYFRELEKATKRVRVFSIGKSEEGREMIVAAISDEANLRKLDRYKEITARLADPRKTNDTEAEKLIHEGKPFYWATGAMHSTETGSPEMLMELAYRLAVEETPFVQSVRRDVITMMTPILETDGRDRVLDVLNNRKKYPGLFPLYWGKYVAHDNNRDGMSLALALTRNVMKTFLDYHPTVLHDLHESVPFLYTSTGSGPYNPWLDPIVINEWHQLAYHEINEMTKRGVPGVWTHGFYDGWAPNYMFFIANGHNSIGRFYETFGNSSPETQDRTVGQQSNRDWFRPNPPLNRVRWSLRNNVNYQQSALLLALNYTAAHKDELLHNFYLKSKRAIAKAMTEGPAAYVLPGDEKRVGQQAELIRLLKLHGIEVSKTSAEMTAGQEKFPANSYVVRMDQPYSRMADMLLDTEYYNVNDPNPYDDTGWTLGPLKNVRTVRVTDPKILQASMALLDKPSAQTTINIAIGAERGTGLDSLAGFFVPNSADCALMAWRMLLKDVKMVSLEQTSGSRKRGDVFIPATDNPTNLLDQLKAAGEKSGVIAGQSTISRTDKTTAMAAPRIALLHTWQSTQNEGWWRLGFEQWQVPYDYISVHTIRDTADLRAKYDVIVMSPGGGSGQSYVNGISGAQPIPWKKTAETPNLGGPDSSDDIRGGMGPQGLAHLKAFVEQGGLLITAQNTSLAAIEWGLAKGVTTVRSSSLQAQGTVLNTVITDPASPVTYGYDRTLAVYFSSNPLFQVEGDTIAPPPSTSDSGGGRRGGGGGNNYFPRPSGRGGLNDPDVVQGRQRAGGGDAERGQGGEEAVPTPAKGPSTGPRVLLRFADEKNLLVSGMLAGGEALANRPAVIDAPYGKGHVLLFAINPMWRSQTQGSYPLIFNAALHFDHLDAGR